MAGIEDPVPAPDEAALRQYTCELLRVVARPSRIPFTELTEFRLTAAARRQPGWVPSVVDPKRPECPVYRLADRLGPIGTRRVGHLRRLHHLLDAVQTTTGIDSVSVYQRVRSIEGDALVRVACKGHPGPTDVPLMGDADGASGVRSCALTGKPLLTQTGDGSLLCLPLEHPVGSGQVVGAIKAESAGNNFSPSALTYFAAFQRVAVENLLLRPVEWYCLNARIAMLRDQGAQHVEDLRMTLREAILRPHCKKTPDELLRFPVPELGEGGTCSLHGKLAEEPYDLRPMFSDVNPVVLCTALQRLHNGVQHIQDVTGIHWLGVYQAVTNPRGERVLAKLAYVGAPSRPEFPLTPEFAAISTNSTVGLSGRGSVIQDVRAHCAAGGSYYACDPKVKSEVCVPLFDATGDIVGILDAEAWEAHYFTPDRLAWLLALLVEVPHHLPQHTAEFSTILPNQNLVVVAPDVVTAVMMLGPYVATLHRSGPPFTKAFTVLLQRNDSVDRANVEAALRRLLGAETFTVEFVPPGTQPYLNQRDADLMLPLAEDATQTGLQMREQVLDGLMLMLGGMGRLNGLYFAEVRQVGAPTAPSTDVTEFIKLHDLEPRLFAVDAEDVATVVSDALQAPEEEGRVAALKAALVAKSTQYRGGTRGIERYYCLPARKRKRKREDEVM